MAWWSGAVKLELQPESDAQPAIVPTQVIFHSVAAPWDEHRLLEHWKTTNLESHFGVDYDGSVGQYIGTETRADANASANRRADGTGAVSVETASRTDSSDPWTEAQLETLTELGVWMHRRHGVPLRVCRSAADPGFGYHSLYAAWSTGGTVCPGPVRVRQFREVLFPRIVARANGADMALSDTDVARIVAGVLAGVTREVWLKDGVVGVPDGWGKAGNTEWKPAAILIDMGKRLRAVETAVAALPGASLSDAQVLAVAERVAEVLGGTLAARVAGELAERLRA